MGFIPYWFYVFSDVEIMFNIDYEKIYAILAVISFLVFFTLACLSVFRLTGNYISEFAVMKFKEKRRERRRKEELDNGKIDWWLGYDREGGDDE
jgi:hypothetical protein